MQLPFDNSYARLPERFFAHQAPTAVAQPELVALNDTLALHLGLDVDALRSQSGAELLAGNRIPDTATPLAMAYAGHQFGGWVPQLGDGRAILLGELIAQDGQRFDLQLKGAGRTPFSRGGDGRAWLGPVLREFLVSEAMAALGIPTTRALAATLTGEDVLREGRLPGAVLTRVARSHIRVGTFQYFVARRDDDALETLTNYVIARHYPELADHDSAPLALLESVVQRQAELVADWLSVGFIHGVMNTDNCSIVGDTIDYGPCAFMDHFSPDKVFSSIDRGARYAYNNQPSAAMWNLACLAQSLLPIIDGEEQAAIDAAQGIIDSFSERHAKAWHTRLCAKIGFDSVTPERLELANELLDLMRDTHADFTQTFRLLSIDDSPLAERFGENQPRFEAWYSRWENLAPDDARRRMRKINPAFIPRNHRVEAMIASAVDGDFEPFNTLREILGTPFEDQPLHAAYQQPPTEDELVTQTFCGT